MGQELIVKPKTEVATQTNKKDILTIYNVPGMLDQIVTKEKTELLNLLSCGAVVSDALSNLAHSDEFFVEIPSGLREMLKTGKAVFDKSSKNPGAYTPNIRIMGDRHISGQATIVQKTDPLAVSNCLSNLAMMAMVQSVLEKLEVIEEKVEDINKGQKNDRIGIIIGHFKGFMDLYPTFKTPKELRDAANRAYENMQEGLAQLHFQIEEERKKLNKAPANHRQTILLSIKTPNIFRNSLDKYKKIYEEYVYDIQLYNRLILLSDVILFLKGSPDAIRMNHEKMVDYCNEYIDDSFKKKMAYLMNNNIAGITNILEYNKRLDLALDGVFDNAIKIECKKEEVKYIKINEHEFQGCL